jgi:murein DD-endopeptidase MepM/ murein hydrolase activator NlpD
MTAWGTESIAPSSFLKPVFDTLIAFLRNFTPSFGFQRCLKVVQRAQKLDKPVLIPALLLALIGQNLLAHDESTPRENLIRIWHQREANNINFYVRNLQFADVTVTFEFEMTNVVSSTEFPFTTTFPGGKAARAFTLEHEDPSAPVQWVYTYFASYGRLNAIHDDSYIYALPYSPGKSYRVSQGYNGAYSHFGSNQYAIDFRMPVGTPIHATRGGVVVAAKDSSDKGGPNRKYEAHANYIIIQHPDGTMGHYVHLAHKGNAVKVGDTIRRGQFIGLSGNTGFSTGPHLHFAVFKARNGKERATIPVRFQTTVTSSALLVEGRSYRAPSTAHQVVQAPAEPAVSRGDGAGSPE